MYLFLFLYISYIYEEKSIFYLFRTVPKKSKFFITFCFDIQMSLVQFKKNLRLCIFLNFYVFHTFTRKTNYYCYFSDSYKKCKILIIFCFDIICSLMQFENLLRSFNVLFLTFIYFVHLRGKIIFLLFFGRLSKRV